MTALSRSDYLQELKLRAANDALASDSYVEMSAADIRTLRATLGESQSDFAKLFGVGPFVMREWEIGTRRPDRKGVALLRLLESESDLINTLS